MIINKSYLKIFSRNLSKLFPGLKQIKTRENFSEKQILSRGPPPHLTLLHHTFRSNAPLPLFLHAPPLPLLLDPSRKQSYLVKTFSTLHREKTKQKITNYFELSSVQYNKERKARQILLFSRPSQLEIIVIIQFVILIALKIPK